MCQYKVQRYRENDNNAKDSLTTVVLKTDQSEPVLDTESTTVWLTSVGQFGRALYTHTRSNSMVDLVYMSWAIFLTLPECHMFV